jgi:2-polyprenyl-3-methyl-5-hydroxy-6-metoxy-1,4-benzoquinol methylase
VTTLATATELTPSTHARERACRFCGSNRLHTFVDLGMSPLCESYLTAEQLDAMEPFYPLHVKTCAVCLLVQLPEYVAPEHIFSEYAYFSSFSDSWVQHARRYTEQMVERLALSNASFVVEIGSNDGYLLQHFVERGIRVLGIEPARNVAIAALERHVPTLTAFFGAQTAAEVVAEHGQANLVIGNNVLAQVPDLNDFVRGLATLLAPRGLLTLEFPHLLRLILERQFDTIYHEHFSYFSLLTAERIMAAHGLQVVDVEELPTHGGSLRLHVRHTRDDAGAPSERLCKVRADEAAAGLDRLEGYVGFTDGLNALKRRLLEVLIEAKQAGKSVVGYGAPGKGNTLLNYCGVRTDFLEYTVDRNPYKHGRFLPGTHIPICSPERIAETRPDLIVILPWNLKKEIISQLEYTRAWGAQFVVPIPNVEVF